MPIAGWESCIVAPDKRTTRRPLTAKSCAASARRDTPNTRASGRRNRTSAGWTGFPGVHSRRSESQEHDAEKHALGLDPMGGHRFSVKIILKPNKLDRDPIQLNWITV